MVINSPSQADPIDPGGLVAQNEQVEQLDHVFDQFQVPVDHFQHQELQVHKRGAEAFNIDQVRSTINEHDQVEVRIRRRGIVHSTKVSSHQSNVPRHRRFKTLKRESKTRTTSTQQARKQNAIKYQWIQRDTTSFNSFLHFDFSSFRFLFLFFVLDSDFNSTFK